MFAIKINIWDTFTYFFSDDKKKEKNQSDYDEDYLMYVNTEQLIKKSIIEYTIHPYFY